nr:protein btn1 [Quercus suber]
MLPMPGSPDASWPLYKARLRSNLSGPSLRISLAFFLFGCVNNIFYVIILSAALDLVGPDIPKAAVLLASIIPGLATKLTVPYFIHAIPYGLRVVLLAGLSTCGMLVVALSPRDAIAEKVAGIVLANVSSGAGEVHFLSLTHYYGSVSLAAWGSGTGGAGLLGAGAYSLATTILGFSVATTLLSSSVIPLVMLVSYFVLLPLDLLKFSRSSHLPIAPHEVDEETEHDDLGPAEEADGLLVQHASSRSVSPTSGHKHATLGQALIGFRHRLRRTKALVLPYMVPLFLVYVAEYAINQGVAPTLLFRLEDSPFTNYRSFYPTYGFIYQLGVFVSRSSLPFIRIRTLYLPAILQCANLVLLTVHALWPFIPSVWMVFVVVFWEGLLGGLVYVSTFAAIREEVPEQEREFSLGATTVSDSGGIFVAGLIGVAMESLLCQWQVRHGRDWCRRL